MVEDLNLFFPTAKASNPEKHNEALLLIQVTVLAKALLRVVFFSWRYERNCSFFRWRTSYDLRYNKCIHRFCRGGS